MLELTATLVVLAGLILTGYLFRPTPAQASRRGDAIDSRGTDAFVVLGAFPSRAAVDSFDALTLAATREGIEIDWDRALREQALDPGQSLDVVARRQL